MTRDAAALFASSRSEGLVKICGLREPDHAAVAARAGADLFGFIFAPARRQVTAEAARACIEAARDEAGSREVYAVGVFVDAPADQINAIAAAAGLDLVQLHGQEVPAFVGELSVPAVKVFRPMPGTTEDQLLERIGAYRIAIPAPAAMHIDGYSERGHGGEGVRADWALAAAASDAYPIVLGGGLDPENVAAAIDRVRPLAVDVSSGVEVGGSKDPTRIEAFVGAARTAFRAINRSFR